MPLHAPASGPAPDPVPAGNHVARCIGLIHIGTIPVDFQGSTKHLNKIRLTFELPNETKEFKEGEGERPFTISAEYNLSLHERATLRAVLESWRGKALTEDETETFDLEQLVGVPGMVNVVHEERKGRVYATIVGITPIPKGIKCPDQVNPKKVLLYDSWDEELFQSLPTFLKDKIMSSTEFQAMRHPQPSEAEAPQNEPINIDDIPF